MDRRFGPFHMDSLLPTGQTRWDAKEVLAEFYRGSKTLRVQGNTDRLSTPRFSLFSRNGTPLHDVSP